MAEIQYSPGLGLEQISYFEKKVWKALRTQSLADQLASNNGDSVIHRVTDLKDTTWGKRAVMTLIPDDNTYGVVGDNQLEDREAGLSAYDVDITYDQFRKAHKNEGVMADRSYWFKWAQQCSDQLSRWASDTKDRLMINTLSGVGYEYEVDGRLRGPTCEWSTNAFAKDVTPPSSHRHLRWDGTAKELVAGAGAASTNVVATDLPTWNTFLDMRAELPMMRIKPVRGKWGNGQDLYVCLVHPRTMLAIKKDTTFQENLRFSLQRGEKSPIFAGADSYMIDGILLICHRYAYTTLGAADGSKWGAGGHVDGARSLFLGAQALGMVEMQGPKIVTKEFDYDNRSGLAMNLKWGMKKIQFPDNYLADKSEQDFGVCALDHAVPPGATGYTI